MHQEQVPAGGQEVGCVGAEGFEQQTSVFTGVPCAGGADVGGQCHITDAARRGRPLASVKVSTKDNDTANTSNNRVLKLPAG